ncbi:unnamed protein product [Spirodela intermedia]|uniref:Uncharacterized protein n=1 Tax=Spirodela intermedia TaxID=51605 RepID=A0A7I8JHX7_SPIIN|nr:unnamed protein product [Spirodela intermedia]CAA6669738.1 unnamed protein product [Spirodela intermedia]
MDRPEQKWWISPPPFRHDGVCRRLCSPHSRGLAFVSDSCFFLIFGCGLKGDRFIPSRSGMDLDQARCSLTMRLNEAPKSGSLAFSTSPKILDAPNLVDDYYLNLMDWGSKNILALALGDSLYLWNATSGDVEDVAWSSDGRTLAVGFTDSTVQIWDTAAARQKYICSELAVLLRQVRVLRGHRDRVSSLSWNCNLLSSGSRDASIINHDVCGLRWSAGGNLLASGGNDNRVARPLSGGAGPRMVPHQPNLLASGGGTADRSIKFWNTQAGSCATTVDTGSQVCALEWNRHRSEILSAHGFSRNQLSLWSYPSMLKVGDMNGHSNRVLHLSQTLRFWKVFGPPQSSGPSFSMNRSFIR